MSEKIAVEIPEPDVADLARDRLGRLWEWDGLRNLWRCRTRNMATSWADLRSTEGIVTVYRAEAQ